MRGLAPWMLVGAVGVAALAVVGGRLVLSNRGSYEEPAFVVESTHDGFEVRAYEPTLEARVTMSGSRDQATRAGFSVLAGYIFGGNTAQRSIDMTTPVASVPGSVSLEGASPMRAGREGDQWTVSFTLPAKWTLDTLPVPDDERVQLVEVPAHRAAVRTFAGRASTERAAEQEATLHTALRAAGLEATGAATLAQFDPPWVLGPWRRNEVQVPLDR